MLTNNCGVYEIKNIVNGHRYIGSSVDIKRRFENHKSQLKTGKHGNIYLQRAYQKYGKDNFVIRLLLLCDPQNVLLYEQICINGLHPEYNIAKDAKAPTLGYHHTDEAKAKIANAGRGNTWNIGRKHTQETKLKHSLCLIGNQHTLGRKLSEEHKRKISLANMGNKHRLGTHHSEETKRRMSETRMDKRINANSRSV